MKYFFFYYPLTFILIFLTVTSFGQPLFSDVSFQAGFNTDIKAESIAIGDYNNDGFEDMYLALPSGKNALFENTGNGEFKDVTIQAGLHSSLKTKCAVWGDINNDGFLDLYLANKDINDVFYLNNGDDSFTELTDQAGINHLGHPQSVNLADINNDGFLDIYITNFLKENKMYLNNGDNTFIDYTDNAKAYDSLKSMGTVFFDYDKDGDVDIYLTHDGNDQNILYQNDGFGVFTNVAIEAGVATKSFAMGADIGDINNDGWPDIYITNLYKNILLLNNGNGTFSDISESAGIQDNGMGWGITFIDCDNDGFQDIYVSNDYHFSPEKNVLYKNNGDLTFSIIESESSVSNTMGSYAAVCFDYNMDGKMDLAIGNKWDGNNVQLFKNNSSTNQWVAFKLLGIESNRNAIGAKISLTDVEGNIYYKEITAGHGWTSQNNHIAHFGLNENIVLNKIEVQWPSGLLQNIELLELNKYYTIIEGEAQVQEGINFKISTSTKNEIKELTTFSIFPNPTFSNNFNIELLLEKGIPLAIKLIDINGQLIFDKTINETQIGPNIIPIHLSKEIANGIYHVVISSGQYASSNTLINISNKK